jgi:osmoprotectant transport system permease protein
MRWIALLLALWPAAARAQLTVGSKAFGESVILGEIVTQVARAAGAQVHHRRALGGTRLVWDALRSGAIDLYPEYTGTLLQEILAGEQVRAEELGSALTARGLAMSEPLGFNDTYALAVREELAARLGLRRISELRGHPELRLGFSSEFVSRHDGWPGLRARYQLPQTKVRGLDHDLAYRGLAAGELDVIDVYTTDAEIAAQHLVVLADDLQFFPRYDAVLIYRLDLASRAPAALAAARALAGRLSTARMAALNARAKLDHVPEETVAAEFAAHDLGLSTTASPVETRAHRIAARTAEHLGLVGASLALAILLALPLGVAAARRPRLGQLVLAVVGIVQTIPSLALLVFMIPVFGIGIVPACVALFLYSLLPIVRNTVAGLADIPPALRESAEALGLSPRAALRLVELPLASRSILAGIKSAAIINVGTATLGALVGAGGLGQPIFTGIRLNDFGLLLEGAVPASLLALLVQALFEALERVIVPRGLRLARES